jgi:hypothetical protein
MKFPSIHRIAGGILPRRIALCSAWCIPAIRKITHG